MDTIFEIEDVEKPAPEPAPKKEPKIKKKRVMSEERKEKLRAQLAKGRLTMANKRAEAKKLKATTKPAQEPAPEKQPEPAPEPEPSPEPAPEPLKQKTVRKPKLKASEPINIPNNNEDLRNEIRELKNLFLEHQKNKTQKPASIVEPNQEPKIEKQKNVSKKKASLPKSNVPSPVAPVPVAPPAPKRKRSTFGGGMVLDFSKFY